MPILTGAENRQDVSNRLGRHKDRHPLGAGRRLAFTVGLQNGGVRHPHTNARLGDFWLPGVVVACKSGSPPVLKAIELECALDRQAHSLRSNHRDRHWLRRPIVLLPAQRMQPGGRPWEGNEMIGRKDGLMVKRSGRCGFRETILAGSLGAILCAGRVVAQTEPPAPQAQPAAPLPGGETLQRSLPGRCTKPMVTKLFWKINILR